jgi:hypothetical protein
MMPINVQDGLVMNLPCQNVITTFTITKEAAILSVGDVKMSGLVVGVTPDNVLYVKFSNGTTLGFLVLKANQTHSEDFLVIIAPDQQLILTNSTNCEEITKFLDQI